jgi:hypothetical protein
MQDSKNLNEDTADTSQNSVDEVESAGKEQKLNNGEESSKKAEKSEKVDESKDFKQTNKKETNNNSLDKKSSSGNGNSDKNEEKKKDTIEEKMKDTSNEEMAKKAKVEVKDEIIDYSEFPDGTVTSLSKNGLKELLDNDKNLNQGDPKREIVVQIMKISDISTSKSQRMKFKFHLSDGTNLVPAFLIRTPDTEVSE